MNHLRDNPNPCLNDDIAAYLDGELDVAAAARCETHLAACPACSARVREQRSLLRELDFLLEYEPAPALPDNFAELVTVRAQSDLRGARSRSEHKLALGLCAGLGLLAFALLGGAAGETVWRPLRRVLGLAQTVADFIGNALYQTGAGLAVVSRNVSGHVLFQTAWQTAFVALFLLVALIGLARLIGDYHRAHSRE